MNVSLLYNSPLYLAAHGARTCWESHDKSDTHLKQDDSGDGVPLECGPKDAELIERVGNKFRHASILEHLVYTFYIEGISRACLQELSRHRMTSPSVKSSRYTLKELKDEPSIFNTSPAGVDPHWDIVNKYCVLTGNPEVDLSIAEALNNLKNLVDSGYSNDITKYAMPEAYRVTEQLTINARSLQNFLSLRSDKSALWEIRNLAHALYNALPEDHKYLFAHCMKEKDD